MLPQVGRCPSNTPRRFRPFSASSTRSLAASLSRGNVAGDTSRARLTDAGLHDYATIEELAELNGPLPRLARATRSRLAGVWLPHTVHRRCGIPHHGRRPQTDGVVLHVNDGTCEGTLSWFAGGSRGVGAHLQICEQVAYQLVDLRAKCWHAVNANSHTIGVEHAGFGRSRSEWLRGAELTISANRVAWILHEFGLGPPRRHVNIFYHSDGGASWGGHACPG